MWSLIDRSIAEQLTFVHFSKPNGMPGFTIGVIDRTSRVQQNISVCPAVHSATASALHHWRLARPPGPGFGFASLCHLNRQWGLRCSLFIEPRPFADPHAAARSLSAGNPSSRCRIARARIRREVVPQITPSRAIRVHGGWAPTTL